MWNMTEKACSESVRRVNGDSVFGSQAINVTLR